MTGTRDLSDAVNRATLDVTHDGDDRWQHPPYVLRMAGVVIFAAMAAASTSTDATDAACDLDDPHATLDT